MSVDFFEVLRTRHIDWPMGNFLGKIQITPHTDDFYTLTKLVTITLAKEVMLSLVFVSWLVCLLAVYSELYAAER